MIKERKVLDLVYELNVIRDEMERKKFNEMTSKFQEFAKRVDYEEVTPEEYECAATTFYNSIYCDKQLNGLSNFAMLLMMLINKSEDNSKNRSVRKHKGSYSIPDKVIDGVISNIIHGERVEDACAYAGISTVTLYNRIRDRGYKDIKKFFKDLKRSLKEEK